ncbi:calpain-5-like isoform X1 [Brienomyrus brachyistius]|uniref:calpain-5-like isoform X1 n=2 Tax=Brienomyrus brachyistius TaxID=42636 RepID=UPI0020B414BA|nr:calpain-5-like isoform X1 [Brienomyrus brachyistius]XP_048885838.1 calpain-5-like isoform X1 [Brienomyrus brachyistius]
MPERVHFFQNQNYYKLKRDCLRQGVLFQDPLFLPTAQSLFYRRSLPPGLTWKRPRELCKDPRLFVDGISTRDLHQGSLGNCWMVAATSCLATEPSLWKKVIPDHLEQEWNSKRSDQYAGIFHFRFWRFGRWTDVVIDDRLPVSQDGTLLFCRSATPREFWSALLEKAYAKLNGCYEALEGGNTAEALVDFTGGVSEPLVLDRELLGMSPDKRKALFQTLARAHSRRALITCSIRPAEGEAVESVLDCGLVRGHAYGITAVQKIRLGERILGRCGTAWAHMVRLHNPWGTNDWTGAWSKGSPQWQQVGRSELEKMGITVRDVGEFWMEFEDFCRFFTDVVVCRLVEQSLLWPTSHWREVRCRGEWVFAPEEPPGGAIPHSGEPRPGDQVICLEDEKCQKGDRKEEQLGERKKDGRTGGLMDKMERGKGSENIKVGKSPPSSGGTGGSGLQHKDNKSRCGGCINHRETFLLNPQFMFEVQGEGDEVLICLQQEDKRMQRKEGKGENLPIGFEVLRVEVNRETRVRCLGEQAASSVYMDSRSVALRVTLGPGRYALLPTTFQPGATGRFLLRVMSHSHIRLRELTDEIPGPSVRQCWGAPVTMVTTVHLRRASGLSLPKCIAPDVYAVIHCEDKTIKTRIFKQNSNPEFNTKAIFYRRRPDSHIRIEIWRQGQLWDCLLGRVRLQTSDNEKNRKRVIDLQGNQWQSGVHGCIYVDTSSSQCLTDL